jgi:D-glycero-alpha-D-manno-heptose-7-phosphate kinase
MIDNTCAQADLHPALVGPHHAAIIEIARRHGAVGWKVNGAGGMGGSVTLLSGPDLPAKRAMIREIEQSNPGYRHIPIHLSRFGLRIWESAVAKV